MTSDLGVGSEQPAFSLLFRVSLLLQKYMAHWHKDALDQYAATREEFMGAVDN